MLVCNVSLRPPRSAIAAELAEVVAATDATATGNVVFATLVDDPANVGDLVDAYLGEIMLEAATAAEAISAGANYDAAIVEAMTTADTVDATKTAATYATLNGTSALTVMSNGNLTATHTSTTGNGGVFSTASQTTGKFYFEATFGQTTSTGNCAAIALAGCTFTNLVTNGTNSSAVFQSGAIWSNNVNTTKTIGAFVAGNVIGVAIDLGARLAWFRKGSGNWNGDAAANPATGAGGVTIGATAAAVPAVGWGTASSANDNVTLNLGASAFSGAVPSGFTSGWIV